MKKVLFSLSLMLTLVVSSQALAAGCGSHNDTRVSGYYRNNGTYVQPHYRTRANNTQIDNWSCRPNQNPHTGAWGTRNPKW